MGTIEVEGGTEIHYKDRGTGRPVAFSQGWPSSSSGRTSPAGQATAIPAATYHDPE